jgi:methionine-rich copper-binding protein CopC
MMVESIGANGVVNAASITTSIVGEQSNIDMIAEKITLNANQIKFTASNDLGVNVVQNSDTKHELTAGQDIRYTLDTNYPLEKDIYTLSLSVNANKGTEFTMIPEGFSILTDDNTLKLKASSSGRQIIIG